LPSGPSGSSPAASAKELIADLLIRLRLGQPDREHFQAPRPRLQACSSRAVLHTGGHLEKPAHVDFEATKRDQS
jgi:hypothetical protein